jgi:aminoglycoside 3-N-acetyltransferase
MHSRADLADDFRRLGVAGGDTVMLHASVRAVGDVAGGPDQIHLALKDALTDEGTLIMYASCPRFTDEVGRGNLTPVEEAEVLAKLPAFDPLTARAARENGALVELFRTYPGTRVNAHVARFAVWGRHTDDLIANTPWNYAFGHGSLLERFVTLDGKILLLGCDHDAVTFLHYAEHIVDISGKRIARFKVPVDDHGARAWRDMEEYDTAEGAHPYWTEGCFARLVDGYLTQTQNDGAIVGNARSYLLPARSLLDFALPELLRLAVAPQSSRRIR